MRVRRCRCNAANGWHNSSNAVSNNNSELNKVPTRVLIFSFWDPSNRMPVTQLLICRNMHTDGCPDLLHTGKYQIIAWAG